MKKGDYVMIYEDPTTRLRAEGKAHVASVINETDAYADVMVWFVGDTPEDTYRRRICK